MTTRFSDADQDLVVTVVNRNHIRSKEGIIKSRQEEEWLSDKVDSGFHVTFVGIVLHIAIPASKCCYFTTVFSESP